MGSMRQAAVSAMSSKGWEVVKWVVKSDVGARCRRKDDVKSRSLTTDERENSGK